MNDFKTEHKALVWFIKVAAPAFSSAVPLDVPLEDVTIFDSLVANELSSLFFAHEDSLLDVDEFSAAGFKSMASCFELFCLLLMEDDLFLEDVRSSFLQEFMCVVNLFSKVSSGEDSLVALLQAGNSLSSAFALVDFFEEHIFS